MPETTQTQRTLDLLREEWTAPYRDALQRILDHGQTHDEPCHALHNGDCADVMQEIARATLAYTAASSRTQNRMEDS